MNITGILETCLYASDLRAVEKFYGEIMGLEKISHERGRHVFFRCGDGVLLVFNPERTSTEATKVNGAPIPLHGSRGAGHVAFRITEGELDPWKHHLSNTGVAIESEVKWPRGGTSVYFRDPAGNSIELATADIWGDTN